MKFELSKLALKDIDNVWNYTEEIGPEHRLINTIKKFLTK